MSYDLYFYKRKDSNIDELKIREYLNLNLSKIPIDQNAWFHRNEYTKAYFYIEILKKADVEDAIIENHENIEEVNLWFSLNYVRLEYFGKFAFDFVEKLIHDLDLYVWNPQSENELPHKPTQNDLFENWQTTNKQSTLMYGKEYDLIHCPIEKSNWLYEYNSKIPELKETYEPLCFVPRIILMKEKSSNETVNIVTWSMNIPNLFPKADYVCLYKEKKRFFKTIKYLEVISFDMFLNEFKDYLTPTNIENVFCIDQTKTAMTKGKFFGMKILGKFDDLLERIEIEKITNYKIE